MLRHIETSGTPAMLGVWDVIGTYRGPLQFDFTAALASEASRFRVVIESGHTQSPNGCFQKIGDRFRSPKNMDHSLSYWGPFLEPPVYMPLNSPGFYPISEIRLRDS